MCLLEAVFMVDCAITCIVLGPLVLCPTTETVNLHMLDKDLLSHNCRQD
jgi:hypothetical protein